MDSITGDRGGRRHWRVGLVIPRSKRLSGAPQRTLSMKEWIGSTVTPSALHSGDRSLTSGESQQCSIGVRSNVTATILPGSLKRTAPGIEHREEDSGNEETGASPLLSSLLFLPPPTPHPPYLQYWGGGSDLRASCVLKQVSTQV